MYIKRFETRQFGGLHDISLDFDKGMNVIIGPNESGKSTIVNAIGAVMFLQASLKRKEKKEFFEKYLPVPEGDFADASLGFSLNGGDYLIQKRWGNKPEVLLKKPDGTIISEENRVRDIMRSIFNLGEKTYQTLVFARQDELKNMLELVKDEENVHSMSSLLRKAVMELDGVSIDRLRSLIAWEYEEMLKRWDWKNQRPESGRGIHNPFAKGIGKILASYYKKEELRRKIKKVEQIEEELRETAESLQSMEKRKKEMEREIQNLSELEEDAIKRAGIEPEIEKLQRESEELRCVIKEWPQVIEQIENIHKSLQKIEEKKKKLAEEQEACRNRDKKEELEKVVQLLETKKNKIKELEQEKESLAAVTEDDLQKLEDLQKRAHDAETAIRAGTIFADIEKKQDFDMWVARDLEDLRPVQEKHIQANGYLKFKLGDLAEIEIKSGEFDFLVLKKEYDFCSRELEKLLGQLNVKDRNEARYVHKKMMVIDSNIVSEKKTISCMLNGKEYAELRNELEKLGDVPEVRAMDIISAEQGEIQKEEIDLRAKLKRLEEQVEKWKEKYGKPDKVLDRLMDIGGDMKNLQKRVEGLKPLPQGFENAEAFRRYLQNLRQKHYEISERYTNTKVSYFEKESCLPEESLEELKALYAETRQEFEQNIHRAQVLIKVKEACEQTLAEMDANSFQPLVDSFTRYLSRITLGNYKIGRVDEYFNIDIINKRDVGIPVKLLSSGTYDSVALSLRFALLEYIYGKGEGFVILDDCLVNLDPERREMAADIIREYALKNQVIFTTCDPEIPQLLGGKTISLG
ncbi:MAG: SMC family ATPase [Syntrophomonadaceae bacterium]|nr:SMC family ATPase [Syntrophomonadaceae bacterium]